MMELRRDNFRELFSSAAGSSLGDAENTILACGKSDRANCAINHISGIATEREDSALPMHSREKTKIDRPTLPFDGDCSMEGLHDKKRLFKTNILLTEYAKRKVNKQPGEFAFLCFALSHVNSLLGNSHIASSRKWTFFESIL